jgi:peptide chain release factor 1
VYALNLVMGLGIGLAIDYTLFLVTRFREELGNGAEPRDAGRTTMLTAGRTVGFSAATVAVMPEPEDVEIDLDNEEYDVERYAASSGPGGQHVNKTASAVRLIHKETGLIVQCCEERSQHKNLDKALRLLKTKLYDAKRAAADKSRSDQRKTQVGSGDRSQRIRTYNFPENRVTDHRINLTLYKLDQIISGELQPVIDGLIDHDREQLRGSMGNMD